MIKPRNLLRASLLFFVLAVGTTAYAGEADISLPDLSKVMFGSVGGLQLMYAGLVVCVIGLIFGLIQYRHTKNMPVHSAMASVSDTIWETCKTYLIQQGKFLAILWALIGACMLYYFAGLQHKSAFNVLIILLCSILGILGSYGVAWFGIRINTRANSRSAFAALRGTPWQALAIPMHSGMSVGLLLVSVELFFMICILTFLPREIVGPLLHRVRDRRVAGRQRAADLRRDLHQDRGHRVRPDEDRVPPAGGRSQEPGRHRGLHGRQCGRQRRADGGRIRNLRRDRRRADRFPRPGAGGQPARCAAR